MVVATAVAILVPICVVVVADDGTEAAKKKGVEEARKAWTRALKEEDKAAMTRILADDYLNVGTDGKTRGKEETIKEAMLVNVTIESAREDHVKIRVHHDSAVVTSRQIITVTKDENRATLEVRSIACWVLKDNRWMLSVIQLTRVK